MAGEIIFIKTKGENSMKKLTAFLLVIMLAITAAACQKNPLPEEDLALSGVLYDYTFKLEGDTVTLPLTLKDFQSFFA